MSKSILDWIVQIDEPKRQYRAQTIGWQNTYFILTSLIDSYNNLTMRAPTKSNDHHEMDVLALRRLILASLVEVKNRLEDRIGVLNREGKDCTAVNQKKKEYRALLDQVEKWRDIRNLTFHFLDIGEPYQDMIAVYKSIEPITNDEVNRVWGAIYAVGEEMQKVAFANNS